MTTTDALPTRPAARVSLATAPLFLLLLVAVHLSRPDLDASWRPVSEYALGRNGWLMTLAFVVWGAAPLALAVALWPAVEGLAGRIGLGLLGLGAVGPLLGSVFPMDPLHTPPDEASPGGMIHGLAAVLSDAIPIAAIVLTALLTRPGALWSNHRPLLWISAGLALVTFLGAIVTMAVLMPPSGQLSPEVSVGWPMRAFIVANIGWVGAAAWSTLQSH